MSDSNETKWAGTTCVVAGCFHRRDQHMHLPNGAVTQCEVKNCECLKFSDTRETMPSDIAKAESALNKAGLTIGDGGKIRHLTFGDVESMQSDSRADHTLYTGSRGGGKTEVQRLIMDEHLSQTYDPELIARITESGRENLNAILPKMASATPTVEMACNKYIRDLEWMKANNHTPTVEQTIDVLKFIKSLVSE